MRAVILRPASAFVLTLLAIEFLDELVFGALEAGWPLIRDDLALTYVQIGLLIGLPSFLARFIEPVLGILGDVWKRQVIVLGGGFAFALALLLMGVSQHFGLLMAALILFNPASGAFVTLSQATLMDHDPARHEQNMARWALAGSLGVVLGPLVLGAAIAIGLGWRGVFLALCVATLGLIVIAWRFPFSNGSADSDAAESIGFGRRLRAALNALRRQEVLRWLVLLEFADLLMDVLLGYLALYFVDVVGVSEGEAGIAVAVWTGVGLVGDLALLWLLERVRGLTYLRFSAALALILFPAFLLVEPIALKLVILALLGLGNAGWYSILRGQLYTALPGHSGTVMVVDSVLGLVGSLIPVGVGLAAQRFGLDAALWLLLLGPVALLIGIPYNSRSRDGNV